MRELFEKRQDEGLTKRETKELRALIKAGTDGSIKMLKEAAAVLRSSGKNGKSRNGTAKLSRVPA